MNLTDALTSLRRIELHQAVYADNLEAIEFIADTTEALVVALEGILPFRVFIDAVVAGRASGAKAALDRAAVTIERVRGERP